MSFKDLSGACLDKHKSLPIDTACFSINNLNDHLVTFFSGFDDCVLCNGQPVTDIPANTNVTVQISTKYPLRIYYNDTGAIKPLLWCIETFSFQEHGRYGWNITKGGSCSSIYTLYEPWNPYLPLLAAVMIYLLAFVILFTSKLIINVVQTYLKKPAESRDDLDRIQESESTPEMLTVSKTSMRLQALDAFRGIAVLLMIFVNNGGGEYVFLKHAAWNGLTVADLVLPWFAWAMGFTIVNSVRVNLRVSVSRTRLIMKQLRRTALLIVFGLMINSQHNSLLSELRFPGVLQLLRRGRLRVIVRAVYIHILVDIPHAQLFLRQSERSRGSSIERENCRASEYSIVYIYNRRAVAALEREEREKMKSRCAMPLLLLVVGLGGGAVDAWGGLFNRFSPEMLSNMGYGSHGGYLGRTSAFLQHGGSFSDNGLDDGADEPCYERRCNSNEDCCPGSVCMNPEGEWPEGRCMFIYGLKQGELCRRDNDCETGLMCAEVAGSDSLSCQPPVTSNKQYSELCSMSSECDISRGLCCQLQRRHRQTPRKMCSYFKDPLVCIGPVAADQVKHVVQYTSGEKRITGKNNRLYKRGFA